MADGQLNLSRRALLGASLVPLILSGAEPRKPVLSLSKDAWSKDASLLRHPGLGSHQSSPLMGSLDPGSTCFLSDVPQPQQGRWIADRVRNDVSPRSRTVLNWDRALARFRRAEAALAGVGGTEDDRLYDGILGRLNKALSALLTVPAPHAAALADKLDLLVQHQVWELRFAEPSLIALRRDARRLAASAA